jgi:tape measure domain-containing protein
MATTEQVELAYRMRFQDEMTAGVKAATEQLKNMGSTMDATDVRAKKAEKSFGTLVTSIDASAKAALAKARADEQLAVRIARINAEVGASIKTQTEANALIEKATRARDVYMARLERNIALEQRNNQAALNFAKNGGAAMTSLSASSSAAARSIGLLGANFGTAGNTLMSFASGAGGVAVALAAIGASAIAAGSGIARAGDQATASLARLGAATGSIGAAEKAYQSLFELSQKTGIAVSESAGAFGRFAIAARDIGATQAQVLGLVQTIQQAGIVAGASAQETASATMQLGQALASGRLQGDELRSILENMPTLGAALARELGVGVGELRKMGSEGKLSADVVFPALLRAGQSINVEFEKMPVTMARSFSILGEAMTRFAADLDRALGLSQGIARAAQAAAAAVNAGRSALGLGTPLEMATSGYETSRERVGNLDQQIANAEGALGGAMPGGTRGIMRRNLDALRQERELALKELERFIAQRNRLEREGQEAGEAEEYTAGQRAIQSQRTRDQARLEDVYKALDKDRTIRAEHAERVRQIDELAARGTLNQEEASRLRTIAERERDEALSRLVERSDRARDATDRLTDAERDHQRIVQQGVSLAESAATENEKYEAQVRALAAALNAGQISQERYNRAVAQLSPAMREARQAEERALQERERLNRQITDDIVRYSADSFATLWSNTGRGFAGLMESMLQMVRRTFARIAAEAVIRPIVTPIVSSVVTPIISALGFGGGMAPGGASAGGIGAGQILQAGQAISGAAGGGGGIMSALGLGGVGAGITSFLATPIFGGGAASGVGGAVTAQAIAAPTGVAGLTPGVGGATVIPAQAGAGAGGMTIGGALGGAAMGIGLGTLAGMGTGAIRGTADPMMGSLLGAGLGVGAGFGASALGLSLFGLGPVGMMIGAGILGGAAGGLLGPTTRGMAARSGGDVFLATDANGQLIITDARGKRWDQGGATQQVQQQLDAINQQARSRGLTFAAPGQSAIGFGAASGSPREFQQAAFIGQLRGGTAAQQTAFATLAGRGGTFDEAFAAADFIRQAFDPLGKAAEQTSAFTAAMEQLTKTYDDAIAKARDLGLSEADLAAQRAERIAKLEADRARDLDIIDRTIAARRMTLGGDARGAGLTQFDLRAEAELRAFGDQLFSLGLERTGDEYRRRVVELEQVIADERLAVMRQYDQQVRGISQGLLESLTLGDLGGLPLEARYGAALASLSAAQRPLMDGATPEELAEFARVAQIALPIAKDFLGVSGSFAELVADVSRTLRTAAPGSDPANLGALLEAQVAGADRLELAVISTGSMQTEVLNSLLTELRRLTAQNEAILARASV